MPQKTRTESPLDDTGSLMWFEMVEREFEKQRGLAGVNDTPPVQKRSRLAMAAVCADLLARAYTVREDMEAAAHWAERAGRYYRRVYARNNPLVKALGAEMP